jgi:hypothetical protein
MLGPEIQAPRYPTNRRLGGWKILVSTLYQDLPIYVVKRLLQIDVGFIGQEATVKCALLTTPCRSSYFYVSSTTVINSTPPAGFRWSNFTNFLIFSPTDT